MLSTIATKDSGAGDYEVSANVTGLTARNYAFRSKSQKGRLTIGQATLTVGAQDEEREYGLENPTFTPMYNGFRNSEDIAKIGVSGEALLTTSATKDSAVGAYDITANVSGASASGASVLLALTTTVSFNVAIFRAIAGTSTFQMLYQYASVNGHRVDEGRYGY